jgi:hypothetical protein
VLEHNLPGVFSDSLHWTVRRLESAVPMRPCEPDYGRIGLACRGRELPGWLALAAGAGPRSSRPKPSPARICPASVRLSGVPSARSRALISYTPTGPGGAARSPGLGRGTGLSDSDYVNFPVVRAIARSHPYAWKDPGGETPNLLATST